MFGCRTSRRAGRSSVGCQCEKMEYEMKSPSDVDRALVEIGGRVFNSGPVKRTKSRRGMTGLRLIGNSADATDAASRGGAGGGDASAVRAALATIVKRTPQVMVRISGGGKTIQHIKAHL